MSQYTVTHMRWYGRKILCAANFYQSHGGIRTYEEIISEVRLFLWLILSQPSCTEHGVLKTGPRYSWNLLQDTNPITFRICNWLTQSPIWWIPMDLLGLKEPKRGTEYSSVCSAEVNNAHAFLVSLAITLHLVREMLFSSILSLLNKIPFIRLKRTY